jgi:hypothetical protein
MLHEGARKSDTSGVKVTRMEYRAGARLCYALGAFLLLVPTTCLGWLIGGEIDKALSAPNWPTTMGVVTVAEMSDESTANRSVPKNTESRALIESGYLAVVEYEYEVDGKQYSSRVINILGVGLDDPMGVIERYPVGAEVTVHYDPNDPAEAALETDIGPQPYYAAAMIASPALFGIIFLILGAVVAKKGRSKAGGATGKSLNRA